MTEADVALTDFAIAIECAAFAVACARGRRAAFVVFFALVAVASVLGGAVHGFASDESTRAYRILWPATLLATIGASAALAFAAIELFASGRWARTAVAGAALVLAAAVLVGHDRFALAVVAYVPASLLLAYALFVRGSAAARTGAAGLLLGVAAGGLQQLRFTPFPEILSHNAFYHLLQMIALALLFVATMDVSRGTKPSPH